MRPLLPLSINRNSHIVDLLALSFASARLSCNFSQFACFPHLYLLFPDKTHRLAVTSPRVKFGNSGQTSSALRWFEAFSLRQHKMVCLDAKRSKI